MKYWISNPSSGAVLGLFDGSTPTEALEDMARDSGHRDLAHMIEVSGDCSELRVREAIDMDRAISGSGEVPEPGREDWPWPAGHSYYWDARALGCSHEQAVRRARLEMGSALGSFGRVLR